MGPQLAGGAGYALLGTHRRPHYDIVLPPAPVESTSRLSVLFTNGTTNPFRRRRR